MWCVVICILELYVLYRYIYEYYYCCKHININLYTKYTTIPNCAALSVYKPALKLSYPDITLCEISLISQYYINYYKDLASDYYNDYYVYKTDKFCITRRTNSTNLKTCIYIPGFNDYFHHKHIADKLYKAGYNVYAISFPNFGFASTCNSPNFSTFSSIDYLYNYIDAILTLYNITYIDLLIGHSTGGLIAAGYADYKNKETNLIVKQLLLSSPFFNWNIGVSNLIIQVVAVIGLFVPGLNLRLIKSINHTACQEFNISNFNPKYKSLIDINVYAKWFRACTLYQDKINSGKIDVKCKVTILRGEKDTVLNIQDMDRKISSDTITIHNISNGLHSVLLSITDITKYI